MTVRHGVTSTRDGGTNTKTNVPALMSLAHNEHNGWKMGICSCVCKNACVWAATFAPALHARYASYVRYLKYVCMLKLNITTTIITT